MPAVYFFGGHEKELAMIKESVRAWGSRRAVCIQSAGGLGKTALLGEIKRQHTLQDPYVLMSDILDFDEPALRVPEVFEARISQQFEPAAFQVYRKRVELYNQTQMEGSTTTQLAQERSAIQQAFVDCFNRFSAKRRVVLLFDTVDAVREPLVESYLLEWSRRLKNVLLIIAGRSADRIYERLQNTVGEDAILINLSPLDHETMRLLLREKCDLLQVRFDPELGEKLLLLAGGRPFWLDLAIRWLVVASPDKWLIESSLQDLLALSQVELLYRREEIERWLVRPIIELRSPMDRLILTMSHVYPLDIEMMAALLKYDLSEAQEIFQAVQSYAHVKSLPGGYIQLQDEMQRMVYQYLWPLIDPNGSHRRREGEIAISYWERKQQALQAEIDRLTHEDRLTRPEADATMSLATRRVTLEEQLKALRVQVLTHLVYEDPLRGKAEFEISIQDAAVKRDFEFRAMLKRAYKQLELYWRRVL